MFKWKINSRGTLKFLLVGSIYVALFSMLIFLRDFNAFNDSFIGFINSFLLAFYLMQIGFYLTPPWGILLLYIQYSLGYILLQVVLFSKNTMIITSIVLGLSIGLVIGLYISLKIGGNNEAQKASNEKT